METASGLRLAEVFVSIHDPRQKAKVRHDLVELLVVAVNAVLVGAETFVEIELWAREKLEWLRKYLRLKHGIPAHDTFGRIFGLIDPGQFEAAFRRWVSSILPGLSGETVAIDGKTSRRSGGVDATALHLVSAFAAGAGLVLGQRATREKSNEITAIPELLSTLALGGCTVTIDAIGAQTAIAELIQERGAEYVLAVKDNQPQLAASIRDFWRTFRAHPPDWTRHRFAETVDKDHGRIETRRCYAFDQLECLAEPELWKGLRSFAVLEAEREMGQTVQRETRLYISSLAPDAQRLARTIRSHWSVENRLHWVMDVIFNDDQMRARSKYSAHNLALLKHITLNLIRLDPIKRKGGVKARRLIAATSDNYRAELLGLK
ncbi:MAG TPA: ISAs1 family transposase [Terracidiphilus sp.]|nr:ISAs1 family transposase [Terracidiphilus sp.]